VRGGDIYYKYEIDYYIREAFMKRSAQREAILSELRMLVTHPTAEELFVRLKAKMPHLSPATVYRNLEQFSKNGLILKLECGGAVKRFDGNIVPHPHKRCLQCGRISDLKNSELDLLQERLLELMDKFNCSSVSVEYGEVCCDCIAKKE